MTQLKLSAVPFCLKLEAIDETSPQRNEERHHIITFNGMPQAMEMKPLSWRVASLRKR